MKQLLHTSGHHVVAALDDRAYAVVKPQGSSECTTVELLPPSHDTPTARDSSSENAIQAVASTVSKDGSHLYCAVSRHDKTLALHSIPITGEVADKVTQIESSVLYKLSKRAGTLSFARVPSANEQNKLSIDIVIAGDLEGNATAYPVPEKECDKDIPKVSRLLLGHTASMLTGVKVVDGGVGGGMKILTSDRDEKIRVSSFPQTYRVEGYLLGHTAFISCLDVATDEGCTHCVSSSGDGTVRLWDYASIEELAVLDAVMSSTSTGDVAKDSKGEEDGGREISGNEQDGDIVVPIGVAISPDGTTIAIVRDGSDTIDIHRVSGSSSPNMLLEKCQTIHCPNQPLAATFHSDGTLCVLAKDPTFLLQYKPERDEAGVIRTFSSAESSACSSLRGVGTQKAISMPFTTLETDKLKKREQPVIEKNEPWNNIERKEKDRIRVARRKKRKREAKAKEAQQDGAEVEAHC